MGTDEARTSPRCPDCGKPMHYYGGTGGWVCCGWKILFRADGWFSYGQHAKDDRLAGGKRRADGILEIMS